MVAGGQWPLGFLLVATPLAAEKKVYVAITCSAEGKLTTVQVGAKRAEKVGDPVGRQVIRRVLPDRHAVVVLTNGVETPYRCIGGFIYMLQRLGYDGIGFVSEPPPAKP